MNATDWDKFKCRCSGIGKMMSNSRANPQLTDVQAKWIADYEARVKPPTDAQKLEYVRLLQLRENSKKVILSDTCIQYLMEVYAWETEGMISVSKESMELAATKKGKMAEMEAVELLSFVEDAVYTINKDRVSNDFLSGELDVFRGESIYAATHVTDIKNAFDYPLFLKKINGGLENGQREQMQGYGDITGARNLTVANCLVSCPDEVIEDMKWKLARRLGAVTIESPDFVSEWETWERSMKFDHIPPSKRVFKINVEPFTEEERQRVYDRVKVCREWLFNFDEMYQKLNINM
jgi:hypothetical protein